MQADGRTHTHTHTRRREGSGVWELESEPKLKQGVHSHSGRRQRIFPRLTFVQPYLVPRCLSLMPCSQTGPWLALMWLP